MRRRRRRLPRWAFAGLVTVVLLALLGWGLDWVARIVAQNQVAATIRRDSHLGASVDLDVKGWFFLPQVTSGDYSDVEVTLHHATAQGLRIQTLVTDLYHVSVPFTDVVHSDVHTITIARTQEHVLITYPDMNAYLAARGSHFTLSQGNGGDVTVTTHIDVLGNSYPVSAEAQVLPGADYLDVVPTQVHTGSTVVDAIGDAVLKLRLTFRIPMNPLPFGQTVRSVAAESDGLHVLATGHDVVVNNQGIYRPA